MSATLFPTTGIIRGDTPNHFNSATAVIGSPVQTVGTGLSDLTKGGTYTAVVDHVYTIKITTAGATDAFEFKTDSGSFGSSTNITGSAQTLANGVTVAFAATTGHTLGDTWTITVSAGVALAGKNYLESINVNSAGSGAEFRIYDGTGTNGTLIVDNASLAVGQVNYGYKLSTGIYFVLYASTTYPDMIVGTE